MAVNRSKEVAGSQEWAKWKASGAIGSMRTAYERNPQVVYLRRGIPDTGSFVERRLEINKLAEARGFGIHTTVVDLRVGRVVDVYAPFDQLGKPSELVEGIVTRLFPAVGAEMVRARTSREVVSSQSKIPQPPSAL